MDSLTPQDQVQAQDRSNSKGLSISKKLYNIMQVDVIRINPEEACGLVAGFHKQGMAIAHLVVPTTNILHSPTKYRMDPHDQLEAFKLFEKEDLELIAIYHSHPTGPPSPSVTDVRQAYYPEVLYAIWSLEKREWVCRVYKILGQSVKEVPVYIH